MGWTYSYHCDRLGRMFNKGDTMYIQGPAYTSADKTSLGYNYTAKTAKRFYGVFSSDYSYAPICFMDDYGNPQYYIEDSAIVDGGTRTRFTITIDMNGGTPTDNFTSMNVDIGSNTWYVFNGKQPTRTGYTFKGLYTAASGGEQVYNADGLAVNGNYWSVSGSTYSWKYEGDIVLYAQWTPNTYTMTSYHKKYNPNTGSWDHFDTTTQSATYGSTYIPPYSKTPTGYHNHQRDSNGGWTVTGNGTFNVYYYPNSYTLDLNGRLDGASNGGLGGFGTVDVYVSGSQVANDVSDYCKEHLYGASYEIKDIRAATGRSYGGVHSGSLSGTITGDMEVVLKFTTNSYTLTVDPNGGTWNGSTSAQPFVQRYNTTKSIANPTRTGWRFVGWKKTGYGTLSGTTFTYGAGDGVLTAKWERIVYKVTFNASKNGGSPDSTRSVNHGDAVGGLPAPTKPYYKLIGWFTKESGGAQISADQIITSDVTYYAQYAIDASATLMLGGVKKPVIAYIKVGNVWRKALAMVKDKVKWKNSTGSS